ncbi:MAG: hypothetical protein ACHQ2Z_16390 [Elusimicrobiota bacterium]
MNSAAGFFERDIAEISSSRALRYYGLALACANLLTAYYWTHNFRLAFFLSDRDEPICWPFAPNCASLHFSNPAGPTAFLWLYCGLALASAILFAARSKSTRWAYWTLTACLSLTTYALIVDYRMLTAMQYMLFFASATFLWFPAKQATLRILLVLTYFWAGILKFNSEWLSGSLLLGLWAVLPRLLPAWCSAAVVLECGISWLLLSSRRALFWPALALFALFHALSWHVVGYYYPLLMLCLLSVFPLSRALDGGEPAPGARRPSLPPAASACWLAFYCALQAVPYLYPNDAALRGGGRLFYGLWMFSGLPECESLLIVHSRNGSSQFIVLPNAGIQPRLRCQPLFAWNSARNRCPRFRTDPDFVDFDLKLYARRLGRRKWNLARILPFASSPRGERSDYLVPLF